MQRFWKLYTKLRIGYLKNYATSDETNFYIGLGFGRIKVCYMRKGYNKHNKMKLAKPDAFITGFHCIFRVCYNGKTHKKNPIDELANVNK